MQINIDGVGKPRTNNDISLDSKQYNLAIAGLIISIVVLVVTLIFYLFVFTLSIISLANTKTLGISTHHYVSTMSTMPKISDNLNI